MATPDTAIDDFTWAKTGLGEATFNGLASLTAIRHGGAVSSTTASLEDDDEVTNMLEARLDESLMKDLVRLKLLDGFSELASQNNSTRQAASAALIEGQSIYSVILARNTSFTEQEKKIFEEILVKIRQLSHLFACG